MLTKVLQLAPESPPFTSYFILKVQVFSEGGKKPEASKQSGVTGKAGFARAPVRKTIRFY